MASALSAPLAVCAIVLVVAGAAKLRAPGGAAAALWTLGLPRSELLVRCCALVELGLGIWTLVAPAGGPAALLAVAYALFTGLSLALARRRSACGCFGERATPATGVQAALSGLLGAVAVLGALAGAHGAGWILGRPPTVAPVLVVGVIAAAYATVLAYIELPGAWGAWEGSAR